MNEISNATTIQEAPEAGKPFEKLESERPIEAIQAEHDGQKSRQAERDTQESQQRLEEVDDAESMLEKEIGRQAFEEMAAGLSGDTRRVFEAVQSQLTGEDRAEIGMLLTDFHSFSVGRQIDLAERTGELAEQGISRDEALRAERDPHLQKLKLQQLFSNSLGKVLEEAQDQEEPSPDSDLQKLQRELNEENNRDYRHSADGDRSMKKLYSLVETHVRSKFQRTGRKLVSDRMRKRELSNTRSNNAMENDAFITFAASTYEAQNLLREIGDLPKSGVRPTLLDRYGGKVDQLEQVVAADHLSLELQSSKSVPANALSGVLKKSGATPKQVGDSKVVVEGSAGTLKSMIKRLRYALSRQPK